MYDTGARPNAPDDVAARGNLQVPNQRVTLRFGTPVANVVLHPLRPNGTMYSQTVPVDAGTLSLNVTTRVTVVELSVGGSQASVDSSMLSLARTGRTVLRRQAPRLERVRVVQGRQTILRFDLSEAATVEVTVERIGPRRRVWRLHVQGGRGSHSFRIPAIVFTHSSGSRFRGRLVAVDALGARSKPRTVTWRS